MSCQVQGNADMYGLGIRVGFYLQWFGSIAAEWLAKEEALALSFTNSFFIAAIFLALLIQTSANSLSTVDIYIILLLTYGAFYYFVPLYIWRLFTGCSPFWDPSRWPRVPTSRVYSILTFMLLVAVASFQMWFWCTGINILPGSPPGCSEYGFFLVMVPLNNSGFVAVNILLNLGLLIACFVHLCLALGIARPPKYLRKKIKTANRKQINEERINALRWLNFFIRLAVASIIIAATELSIQWNGAVGVNDVSTAGQTIPLVIGISVSVRVLHMALKGDNEEDNDDEDGPQPPNRLPPQFLPQPIHRPAPIHRPTPIYRTPLQRG